MHIEWVRSQIASYKSKGASNPFWDSVGLVMAQLSGMVEGYNYAAPIGKVCIFMFILYLTY